MRLTGSIEVALDEFQPRPRPPPRPTGPPGMSSAPMTPVREGLRHPERRVFGRLTPTGAKRGTRWRNHVDGGAAQERAVAIEAYGAAVRCSGLIGSAKMVGPGCTSEIARSGRGRLQVNRSPSAKDTGLYSISERSCVMSNTMDLTS